jgi:hypothetical protein
MPLVADGPGDRVRQLTVLTDRLTSLITQETALYAARQPGLPSDLATEKLRLANIYRIELQRIAEDRALIAGASALDKKVLAEATEKFQSALAAHGRALGAVRAVSEGGVKAIAEEVAASRAAPSAYGRLGPGDAPERNAGAVTLNRTA